jgi:hypothetical protein
VRNHPANVLTRFFVPLRLKPQILEDGRRKGDVQTAEYQRQIQDLYAEIGELTTKLNWLKKNLALNWSREQRTMVRILAKKSQTYVRIFWGFRLTTPVRKPAFYFQNMS